MVFYVQNRTGVPLQVTLDSIVTLAKPQGVQITIAKGPPPAGRHLDSFRLQNPMARAVPRVNFTPDPLTVVNTACTSYEYGLDRDGDLLFVIHELLI